MKALDQLEAQLQKKVEEAQLGLDLCRSMRKLLQGTEVKVRLKAKPAPKPTVKPKAPVLNAAQARKQKAASKEYWRKVKAGEIKRKGFKAEETTNG